MLKASPRDRVYREVNDGRPRLTPFCFNTDKASSAITCSSSVAITKTAIWLDPLLDDQFHEPDHGTGDLLVDSSFAVR